MLEVTHRQFPDGGVYRLARAQTRVIGLGERSPTPAHAIDRQNVVGIAYGFEVHQQRRKSELAQSHGGKQRALHAMRHPLPENHTGRITGGALGFLVVAYLVVEELLDLGGCRGDG